ncbi:MAG: sigma-54 dependent transcriptional regulator [Proteobacteria bacterium]|nr:sigma-54 dependent transcriptional regulator [Pseudomonadota bacterium]MBU4471493.1 sigma-54 dependent transcriptional regulator [Pseudomonadota bacterium]MCG2752499.1 sigma-54 dependent transcriptional regulator [Desulfobacteraceae bacterium]
MQQALEIIENIQNEFNSEIIPVLANTDDPIDNFHGIVGKSDKINRIFKIIAKVADSDTTILINGETGTGKGLLCKSIHEKSYRRNNPFIKINCGAIPDHLLESELFGHEKGAFTGATNSKPGKFELADGGTVFLDEIGDMSYDLQVKVLRVLEEGEFERVGGCKTLKTNVRIIAATHRNLEEEVKKGKFREDLFYRLYVIPVYIAPLRERKSDIPLLISHFLNENIKAMKGSVIGITKNAMTLLTNYSWPGNVRELKNVVERMVVLSESGIINTSECPMHILNQGTIFEEEENIEFSEEGICLNTAVTEFEKKLITQSLEKTNWVKNRAAKLLHLNRTTLVEKIKRYNLEPLAV